MPTLDFRASKERRAYFRLLRYLLSEEVRSSYGEEDARPLSPRMEDLLRNLEQRESSDKH